AAGVAESAPDQGARLLTVLAVLAVAGAAAVLLLRRQRHSGRGRTVLGAWEHAVAAIQRAGLVDPRGVTRPNVAPLGGAPHGAGRRIRAAPPRSSSPGPGARSSRRADRAPSTTRLRPPRPRRCDPSPRRPATSATAAPARPPPASRRGSGRAPSTPRWHTCERAAEPSRPRAPLRAGPDSTVPVRGIGHSGAAAQ